VATTSNSKASVNYYDANYGNFHSELYGDIRRAAFGEDMGQSGWQTAAEQDQYLSALSLVSGKKLLDVCCGSGGPALLLAHKTGCALTGIDLHEAAISAARALAVARGATEHCEFRIANAAERLPFNDEEFDAITCIDAIIHLPDRPRVLSEWKRVLKCGGKILFTDSTVITGPLTKEEIAVRSSIGYFQFVPPDYDRRVLERCGCKVLVCEDVTQNMAELAAALYRAREAQRTLLTQIEGESSYQGQQTFLEVTSRIAQERRLSRFLYVAEKHM
jgi:ubiquinone/menaquinone biosynthesis C-methylase UbiE